MKRKSKSTIRSKGPAIGAVALLLGAWSLASALEVVPRYMLPAPWEVVEAFITELPILPLYGICVGVDLFKIPLGAWMLKKGVWIKRIVD